MNKAVFYTIVFLVALSVTIYLIYINQEKPVQNTGGFILNPGASNPLALPSEKIDLSLGRNTSVLIGLLNPTGLQISEKTSKNLPNTPVIECISGGLNSLLNTRRGAGIKANPNEEIRYNMMISDVDDMGIFIEGRQYLCRISVFSDRDAAFDDKKMAVLDKRLLVASRQVIFNMAP
jgi:hypothetical protein